MAIKGAIPMQHGDVFPHGCFVVGEVQAMRDFDRSTREQAVQAVDRDTGELVWTVDVIDADPDARDKTVRVKITAPVQPVPPETASAGGPAVVAPPPIQSDAQATADEGGTQVLDVGKVPIGASMVPAWVG